MPLLAGLLLNFFTGFIAFLARYFSQKVLVASAITAVMAVMFIALYVAMRETLDLATMGASQIHPMFGAGVEMVISARSASLIATYITFWAACELYKWKIALVSVWSKTI